MRTSLLLAYKSVRTLRRAGLDYATSPRSRHRVHGGDRGGRRPLFPASPATVAYPVIVLGMYKLYAYQMKINCNRQEAHDFR